MRIVVFLFTFFLSINLHALIGFEDAIFPELATSGRALAMGSAFICKVDDSSAAFYNPAGLGTIRYAHIHLTNFAFEVNKGMTNSVFGGGVDALGGISKIMSLEGTRQSLLKKPGLIGSARFQMQPNITFRYFSIGYLMAMKTRATVTNTTSATGFEYANRTDSGPYAAINFSLFGGIIKAGASAIILTRKEINKAAAANTTLNIASTAYSRGTAVIVTSGFRFTLPVALLPTIAANLHNTLDKKFSAHDAGAPTKIYRSMDVGFSITPQIGSASRVHFEIDYKDLSQEFNGVSMTRRLLMGLEFDFSRTFFIRMGYGDGYGTFGIGVQTSKAEFDLTTYSVDTTSSGFRGHEDRRFVLGLSSGF